MRKKILIGFSMSLLLLATQANADMWEVDQATALGFTSTQILAGGTLGDFSIYDSPTNKVYGPGGPNYGDHMSGDVGFAATLYALEGGIAGIQIYDNTLSLPVIDQAYEGIKIYAENDDDDHWDVQLVAVVGDYFLTSDVAHLDQYQHTWLTATNNNLALFGLGNVSMIGIRVMGHDMGSINPAQDTFHVSVVPVPGALLLGMLGLSAAGIKLRKFA